MSAIVLGLTVLPAVSGVAADGQTDTTSGVTADHPEKPKPEVPEKPKPEVPEKPKPEVPEKPKPEVPEKPKPEVPEKPKPEVPEKPKPEQPGAVVVSPAGEVAPAGAEVAGVLAIAPAAAAPAAVEARGAADAEELAFTGMELPWLVGLATLLMLTGAGLLLLLRRRSIGS